MRASELGVLAGQRIVEQLKAGGVSADLQQLSKAGHQVFLEQPFDFNAALIFATHSSHLKSNPAEPTRRL